jgi:hypothetical protein
VTWLTSRRSFRNSTRTWPAVRDSRVVFRPSLSNFAATWAAIDRDAHRH